MPKLPDQPAEPGPRAIPAKPAGQVPLAVSYARGLLLLQGVIWAVLAANGAVVVVSAMTGRHFAALAPAWAAVPLAAGGFAAMKLRFRARLGRGSDRARKAVIGAEMAMAGLGVLLTAGAVDSSGGLPAGFFALAGFAGGGLSLTAALGLLRRGARNYCSPPSDRGDPARDHGTRPPAGPETAAFLRHAPRWGLAARLEHQHAAGPPPAGIA
ncbi:MAG TPA: hypothetical protein DHU96_00480 [Actinobacteria bacterium]|nr:hypothetical protein [Actinomycetota bacterium]